MRFFAVVLLGAGACVRDVETPFPDGVAPWEESTAPAPEPRGGEKYPEAVVLVTGETGGRLWLHGRGYVHADVAGVWEALRDPAVCADRRGVDAWSVRHDVEDGFDVSFAIDNTVRDVLTVSFTVTWRQAAVEGDVSAPGVVGIRYQKTSGSSLIDLLRGSIVLRPTDEPDRTEVVFVEHLEAPGADEEDLRCYHRDLFDEIGRAVRGEPLPEVAGPCG